MSELLEEMKMLNEDHAPDGYPAIKMSEINELVEIIEKQSLQLAKANERVEKLTSYVRIIATTPPTPQTAWSNESVELRKFREDYINEAWDYLEQLRKEQECGQ